MLYTSSFFLLVSLMGHLQSTVLFNTDRIFVKHSGSSNSKWWPSKWQLLKKKLPRNTRMVNPSQASSALWSDVRWKHRKLHELMWSRSKQSHVLQSVCDHYSCEAELIDGKSNVPWAMKLPVAIFRVRSASEHETCMPAPLIFSVLQLLHQMLY